MKKKILVLLLTIILFPLNVYALDGTISIDCPTKGVKIGSTVECVIKGTTNNDEVITSIHSDISVGSGLKIESLTPAENIEFPDISNDSIDVIISNNNVYGSFNIGTLKLTVKDSANPGKIPVNLKKTTYGDKSYQSNKIDDASSNIIVLGSTLETLSVTNGTVEGGFSQDKTALSILLNKGTNTFALEYTLTNKNDSVSIKGTESGDTLDAANITFSPNEQGIMAITLSVGETGKYDIIIKREKEDYNNRLKSLSVGSTNVDLSKCVSVSDTSISCSVNIQESGNKYSVSASLNDTSNFKISSGLGEYNISNNSVTIVIETTNSDVDMPKLEYNLKITNNKVVDNTPKEEPKVDSNVNKNPQTKDISIFAISLVLIASLVITIVIYNKNMKTYN